jgi:hypothetical protein
MLRDGGTANIIEEIDKQIANLELAKSYLLKPPSNGSRASQADYGHDFIGYAQTGQSETQDECRGQS